VVFGRGRSRLGWRFCWVSSKIIVYNIERIIDLLNIHARWWSVVILGRFMG